MSHRPAFPSFPSATSTSSCAASAATSAGSTTPPRSAAKASSTTTSSFRATTSPTSRPVMDAMRETGQISSMLCFSPDFTHPDPDERLRQVERQKRAIDSVGAHRRQILPDTERAEVPGLSIAEGVARAAECITRSLDYAAKRDVILCLENHYKVGDWLYAGVRAAGGAVPGAARRAWRSRRTSASSTTPRTPSSAASIPIAFLEKIKHRVVTMHASDRYLVPGTTLEEIRCGRRDRRLSRQAATRRDREGRERLRRHLPHPAERELHGLDFRRGWDERPRRAGALGRSSSRKSAREYYGT